MKAVHMYQYKAILRKTGDLIAEGHTFNEIEHGIKHFKRAQKRGEHTNGNDRIEIYHTRRNKLFGFKAKDELVKVI